MPTAYTTAGRYVPEGVNRGNEDFIEAVVPTTMANADTLAISTPQGSDPTLIPFAFVVVNKAVSPMTYSQNANIGFTSFAPGTSTTAGTINMTATGTVTAGDTIIIRRIGA